MPLYEFYCEPCHTIFTFRSARVDTSTVPACPKCGHRLRREVSTFAHIIRGASEAANPDNANTDDMMADRMEQAAARLGDRLQALEEDDADPRDAVRVMRELAEAGGLRFNAEVREAMARIEAGEDPERIDEEFSEVFDTDNPFEDGDAQDGTAPARNWLRRLRGPARDPNWYDLTSNPDH
jgi:putative FmdB family regulatory protein